MRFWFSPLPLSGALITELEEGGLKPWPNEQCRPDDEICLLVYDSPERHIAAAVEEEAEEVKVISSAELADGYSQLLRCREASGQPLLAGWRLQRLGPLGLQQWLAGNDPSCVIGDAEPTSSLVASVILSLLDTQPQLLETYNDLELQAELLGSEADLNYRQRLYQAVEQSDPMPQLLVGLRTREGELQQARHEAQSTRLEMQQLQEEVKELILADNQKQQLLDKRSRELQSLEANIQTLQQELKAKVNNLEQQLQIREKQLQDSHEDAELTLGRLNQVEEELKELILEDDQKQQLLDNRTQELQSLEMAIQALQKELQPKVEELENQLQTLEKQLQGCRDDAEDSLLQLHQSQGQLEQELKAKVTNLEKQLQTREKQLRDRHDEAELTLLQLHQVQEELEQLFLADRQKHQLLDQRNQEIQNLQGDLQALKQELQPKINKLGKQLQAREKQLQDTREDAELTLLQLHQVQEELEQLFLADRQKQQLLNFRSQEIGNLQGDLQTLKQELQSKANELEKQLQEREKELQHTRDDAQLTLLQLHQVQDELERYFLQTRAGSELMEAQTSQLNRAKRLLAKLAMKDFSPSVDVAAFAIEVLPATEPTSQQPSLQVQALINNYASSLVRASELLTKAMRH